VLQDVDVPVGYAYDKDNSLGPFRGPLGPATDPSTRALIRADFESGYIVRYTGLNTPRWSYINSAAFVFKRSAGAVSYFEWIARAVLRDNPHPSRRTTMRVGAEGRVYEYGADEPGTFVLWRHGRVVAMLSCYQTARQTSLARSLARTQERRIATALS
jgi:hypothetical protein